MRESGLVPRAKEDGRSSHCHHCHNRHTSRSASSPLRYEIGGVAPRRYLEKKEISIPTLHGLVHVVINLISRLSLSSFPGLPCFYLELLWRNQGMRLLSLLTVYCIVGNFWGRKLSRFVAVCESFLYKIGGRGISLAATPPGNLWKSYFR